MSRSLQLFTVLILASYNMMAQATVDFKVEYMPGHNYLQTLSNRSHTVATYTGNTKRLNELKSKGMKNPTVSDKQLLLQCLTKGKSSLSNGRMPMTMQFSKAQGNSISIPKNYTPLIHLHKYAGKEPVVDSVSARIVPADFKKQWLPMIQTMLTQMVFPSRKISVGGSMREENLVHLPISGKICNITIVTVYILKKASSDSAWFDMTQTYTLKSGSKDIHAVVSGTGTGKMVYDIKKHFIARRETTSDMTIKITQGNINVESIEHNTVLDNIKMAN